MGNAISLLSMILTIIFVPWLLSRIPYFKRSDVVARRVAKAKLPGWVSLAEFLLFGASAGFLSILFFILEEHTHQAFYPNRRFLSSINPSFSTDSIFLFIQAGTPVILALPLSMLFANFVSWLIPPMRNAENKIMAEGVPGYSWHELNRGLIKATLIMAPVCLILVLISLINF